MSDEMIISGMRVFEEIPPRWDVARGPITAPPGYTVICNGESRLSSSYRRGLVRNEKVSSISGIPVYPKMPAGWDILWNATTAPTGYVFIWNRKSHFTGEYEHGLIPAEKVS